MIIATLPDHQKSNFEHRPHYLNNKVLFAHTKERYFYPQHNTPYLFATNFLNKGQYVLNNQHIAISEKYFYFLNPHDRLAITFNDSIPRKTLFIFFNDKFVKESVYSLTTSYDQLLEQPLNYHNKELRIPSVPFQSNQAIANLLLLLTRNFLTQHDLDNKLFDLITEFLKLNNHLSFELKKIKAIKKSTKEELFKRLFVAKEFIEDNALCASLTIDEIAKEACLNKFHFLANFKDLYSVTPHQYLVNLKLQKAYQLLQQRQLSVTEVCYAIGFESLATFSSLFKKRFKITPSSVLLEKEIPNFQ